jgi:hypothetical protein
LNKKERGRMKEEKKQKNSKLAPTFLRNALRSNLDLTSLADTKAGILISINGFILTVSVTASGFVVQNGMMTYAFISIILTSLGSIIFAVLAVKPRRKDKLVHKAELKDYRSLLYYQDMADLSPKEYKKEMNEVLKDTEESTDEMITHLHILGAEIKKKYFWLTQAYRYFSVGLVVSASLIIYALMYVEETAIYNLSKGNVVYKAGKFYNVFEPSGATTMPDGKVLIVEDERSVNSLKLLDIQQNGKVVEEGHLYLNKALKKIFKKDIEDLEAITSDGNIVYAITSHTVSKKNGRKPSRERFIMFKYEDGAITNFHMYSNLKKDLEFSFPELSKNSSFYTNTINIEGLCFDEHKKDIIIGFRAPVVNSAALLLAIENPKDIFLKGSRPIFSQPIKLNLHGMGIRDITYDAQKKGFWIIAGSPTEKNQKFSLWFWDREHKKLTNIKNHPDIKHGEGITLVKQKSKIPGLFIVEDDGRRPNKSADYIIIDRDSL